MLFVDGMLGVVWPTLRPQAVAAHTLCASLQVAFHPATHPFLLPLWPLVSSAKWSELSGSVAPLSLKGSSTPGPREMALSA